MPTPPHQTQTLYLSLRSAAVKLYKTPQGAESHRPSVKRGNNAANLLRYLLVPPLRSRRPLIKPFDCKTSKYDIDHGLRPVREVSYLKSLLCHRSLSQTRYQILNEHCSSGGNTPVVFGKEWLQMICLADTDRDKKAGVLPILSEGRAVGIKITVITKQLQENWGGEKGSSCAWRQKRGKPLWSL